MISGIYKWTSPNGKSYIGQAQNLKKRKREFLTKEIYTSKGSAIDNARHKYKDFTKWSYEILEECAVEELNEKEIYWIAFYNTYNDGYNSTIGGDSTKGRKMEEWQKEICRKTLQKTRESGKLDNWYKSEKLKSLTSQKFKGRTFTDEQKKQISDSLKEYFANNTISEETRKKLSEVAKKRFETGWVNKGQIHAVSKPVQQFDLEGNLLNTYSSMNQAAKAINKKDAKQISKCCRGLRDNVYGYIWKYK